MTFEARHLTSDTIFVEWRKSSRSNPNGNQCVEVSFGRSTVGLRDSKNASGAVLAFDHRSWASFLTGLAADGFRTRRTD